MTSIESVQKLCTAVRNAHANIADSYADYIKLAMSLASGLGEAGRPYFHELCSYSAKYNAAKAERDYTQVMRHSRGAVGLGSAFFLAEQQGVKVEGLGTLGTLPPHASHTHAHVPYNAATSDELQATGDERPATGDGEEEDIRTQAGPQSPLPYFAPYDWPEPLATMLRYAENEVTASMMTLSTFTVLGSTVGRHARLLYDHSYYHTNLIMGIFGPSGAGKSTVTKVMLLAQPIHDELTAATDRANAQYAEAMRRYEGLGKERLNQPLPVEPPQRMHFLPADSTGAGMKQNIVQNRGEGMIYSPEADELSNALSNKFGQWSPMLRALFDHDAVSYYRKGDRRLVEVKHTYVSVGVTGTMGQIRHLFHTAENGLAARPLLLAVIGKRHLRNPFGSRTTDLNTIFLQLGRRWQKLHKLICEHGTHTLCLTEAQQNRFFAELERIFRLSGLAQGTEMDSSVFRLGVNIGRILTLTGLMRAMEASEAYDWHRPGSLLTPSPEVAADNVKDGIIQQWDIHLTDADFEAVLALAYPLYRHATHILSFLPRVEVKHRFSADRSAVMELMPDRFNAAEFIGTAHRLGYSENTARMWLKRTTRYGLLRREDGYYRKV